MSIDTADPKLALPEALADVMTKYTTAVLTDATKLRNLLNDRCGEHRQQINMLVSALGEGALDHIANSGEMPREEAVLKLATHLQKQLGLSAESALWVGRTWFDAVKGSEAKTINMEMFHRAAKRRCSAATRSLVVVVGLVVVGVVWFLQIFLPTGTLGLTSYALVGVGAFKAIHNRVTNLKNAQAAERMWDPNLSRRLGLR